MLFSSFIGLSINCWGKVILLMMASLVYSALDSLSCRNTARASRV